MHARKVDAVFPEMRSAKSSITISLPKGSKLSEDWTQQLLNRGKRVKLTVISNQKCSQCDVWLDESFPFPFVIIDEKVLWLGLSLEGARGVQPPYVAARLRSNKMCEYFLNRFSEAVWR
ncbi:hypothetical protein BGM26_04245 [Bacillus sp. FJAT-29790]|uniref:hypothetical protein n=1 Tax=Bacillus sp. FJAT-29790 TaxID=1895002 RepID=UPI001C24B9EA|nr:hypothetical protein [Bacillus sp. FJAT-29790]MBU8878204.1 hypothetical protein [Bacillus sp. FJAT-29790]